MTRRKAVVVQKLDPQLIPIVDALAEVLAADYERRMREAKERQSTKKGGSTTGNSKSQKIA